MSRHDRVPLRPLMIGIAGCGRLVREYYAPALGRLPGVGSIAVADPLAKSRAAALALFPTCNVHSSYEALLDAKPDALLVASPPSTHLGVWNAASAADVPVFMEKPFVLAHELPLVLPASAARPLLMMDFNRRFWPTYRALRDHLREGRLGTVEGVELTLHVDLAAWSRVTAHRLDPAEGGVLHDLGSQVLDLAEWLLPQAPTSIAALAHGPGDHLRLHLRDASGTSVSCDIRYGSRTRERILIHGERGRLRLDDPNMGLHVELAGERGPKPFHRGTDLVLLGYRGLRRARSMARHSIARALDAFLDAVRDGTDFQPGFAAAVRNVAWIEAASRALASGKPVELPSDSTGGATLRADGADG